MLTNTTRPSCFVKVSSLTYSCSLPQLVSMYGQYEEFYCCGTTYCWNYTDKRYVSR